MIMRPVVPTLATAPTKNQLLGQFLAASSERRASHRHALRTALFRADLEFDLPAAIRIRVLHPKFEGAKRRHDRVDLHRYCLSRLQVVERRKLDLEKARLLQLAFGVPDDLAGRVAAAYGRREEPELRRAASDQTEFASFDEEFGALLHPLRHDAQRLHRRTEARDGRHRGLQTDVIGPRG